MAIRTRPSRESKREACCDAHEVIGRTLRPELETEEADAQSFGVMYNEFFKKMPSRMWGHDPDRGNFHNLVKQVTPDYGVKLPAHQVKATWLGHASFLVEMPAHEGADRGVRVLFDPAYSERCSPLSFIGNLRYSRTSAV